MYVIQYDMARAQVEPRTLVNSISQIILEMVAKNSYKEIHKNVKANSCGFPNSKRMIIAITKKEGNGEFWHNSRYIAQITVTEFKKTKKVREMISSRRTFLKKNNKPKYSK